MTTSPEPIGPAHGVPGADAPAAPAAPKRRKRWTRRLVFGGLLVLALATGALVYFTQGPGVAWGVRTIVGSATGCEVNFSSARIRADGTLVVHDLVLHAPDVPGEPGDIVRAAKVVVFLDWSHWLSGKVTPTGVDVHQPVLRVAQSADGALNIARLRSRAGAAVPGAGSAWSGGKSTGPREPATLPFVRAVAGSIEVGEDLGGTFRRLGSLPVQGSVTPISGESGKDGTKYVIAFAEIPIDGAPKDSAIRIDGSIDLEKGIGRAELAGLDLQQWTPDNVPGPLRAEWRALNLDGKIAGAAIEFDSATGLTGEVRFSNVAISLPVPEEESDPSAAPAKPQPAKKPPLPAARRVRMHGVSGSIRLTQDGPVNPANTSGGVIANLKGMIEDLPCTVNLSTTGLDPESAIIDCEVLSENFDMSKSSALRSFAPRLVLARLRQFGGPTAILDARVKVRREASDWASSGSVLVRDGRAAFADFPYPFVDIKGTIEFDKESVRIVGLSGLGLTGATMVAHGRVWPPDTGDNVKISVEVRDAPIDEVLASAIDANATLAEEAVWKADVATIKARAARGEFHAASKPRVFAELLGPDRAASLQGTDTWRSGLYKALFSAERHAALLRDGLVITRERAAELRAELAALDTQLAQLGRPGGIEAAAEQTARLDLLAARSALAAQLLTPEFGFGGTIDRLTVEVNRDPVAEFYNTDVRITFRDAGMVPEPFPLPIIAKDLRLEVREDSVSFAGESFSALRGGTATVSGSVDVTNLPDSARVPAMTITATHLPVDDLLIRAIPERMSVSSRREDETLQSDSAPEILSALGIVGQVDTKAVIRQLADGSPGFDVTVTLPGLDAHPRAAAAAPAGLVGPPVGGLMLSNLEGTLHVTENLLEVRGLRGSIRSCDSDAPPGTLQVDATSIFPSTQLGKPGAFSAVVKGTGVMLEWPIEDLAAAFSTPAGARLVELREQHRPTGSVDASVVIEPFGSPAPIPAGGQAATDASDLRVLVGVDRASDVRFTIMGGRLGASLSDGGMSVRIDPPAAGQVVSGQSRTSLLFDHVSAQTTFDGAPAGMLTLDGVMAVDPSGELRPQGPLEVQVSQGSLASGFTRGIITRAVSDSVGRWITRHDVAGDFDANLRIAPRGQAEAPVAASGAASAGPWDISGTITPRSLALTRRGVRSEVAISSGIAEVSTSETKLRNFRFAAPTWSADADGSLRFDDAEHRWTLDALVNARGGELEPSLRAILPATVDAAISQVNVKLDGPWELSKSRLMVGGRTDTSPVARSNAAATTPARDDDGITRAAFDGEIDFHRLSADIGVAITEATGKLVATAKLHEGADSADVRLDITAPTLLVAGVPLTEAGTVITTGRSTGEVLAPTIFGRCAAGQLSGSAFLRNKDAAPGKEFGARIELGGVRVGDLLAEIDRVKAMSTITPSTTETAAAAAPAAPSASAEPAVPTGTIADATPMTANAAKPAAKRPIDRGTLTAQLAIGGTVGVPASRRGRGSVTIDGGDVLGVPLMSQLLELSNLIPPMGDRLNYFQASFYLEGERAVFEDLSLQSGMVEVVGSGHMTTPGMELDLVLNSRGRARVPLWSDLFEGLRNEFITTTVKGTLREPKIESESLRGTKSLFSGIFGPSKPAVPAPATPAVNPIEQATAPTE